MKKAISILLVVAITASLCMTAFAADVVTVTNYCDTCGKDTQQYRYEVESFNRVVECPDHAGHDAEEYYVNYEYECLKCGESWIDINTLVDKRYVCLD